MAEWTKQDSTAAATQGWGVFEIWDTDRLQLEIQKDGSSNTFISDEAARGHVKERASATSDRDALCHKAWSIVFHSKIAPLTRKKK